MLFVLLLTEKKTEIQQLRATPQLSLSLASLSASLGPPGNYVSGKGFFIFSLRQGPPPPPASLLSPWGSVTSLSA